ncbi:MAG: hypothetical protein P4L46_03180 [Fimbriimonas sp.]|nr:hypothetical protein [Fimbriimonas sp.]
MNLLVRAYSLCLLAYPRSYRDAYGQEMKIVFADMLRDSSSSRGRLGVLAMAIGVYVDVIAQALKERFVQASPRQWALWILAMTGIVTLICVNQNASQGQAPALVLISSTVLLCAYDPKHIWRWGSLFGVSIPIFHLMLAGFHRDLPSNKVWSEFGIMWFAMAFAGVGVFARSVLESIGRTQRKPTRSSRFLIGLKALLLGMIFGACDFTLITPVFVLTGLITCGVLLGSFLEEPVVPAAWVGLGVPVAIVFEMATRQHPARHHYIFLDAGAILWCVAAATIAHQTKRRMQPDHAQVPGR